MTMGTIASNCNEARCCTITSPLRGKDPNFLTFLSGQAEVTKLPHVKPKI